MKPIAVGAYIFAGGYTLGVSQHFHVAAHYEQGKYGVESSRANFPHLEFHLDPATWPTRRYSPAFVYANPPCAPWSAASHGRSLGWRDDPRTSCWRHVLRLIVESGCALAAVESVRQFATKGWDMLVEMASIAADAGLRTTVMLCNALDHGVPQVRRRLVVWFHKIALRFPATGAKPGDGCGELLRKVAAQHELATVAGDGWPIEGTDYPPANATLKKLLAKLKPGQSARDLFDEIHGRKAPNGRKANGKVVGRPAFLVVRQDPDKPCGALTGGAARIHPWEDRYFTVQEHAALCGFPSDYEFVGSLAGKYAQVAQGLMPPVAEYIGRVAAEALQEGAPCEPTEAIQVWEVSSEGARRTR